MMTASRPGGQAGRRAQSGSGCWVTWAAKTSCELRPVNGGRPVKQLVAQDADRVDVDAMVELRLGGRLLRRHVGRRAERHARAW